MSFLQNLQKDFDKVEVRVFPWTLLNLKLLLQEPFAHLLCLVVRSKIVHEDDTFMFAEKVYRLNFQNVNVLNGISNLRKPKKEAFLHSYMALINHVCACLDSGSCVSLSVRLFRRYTALKCMRMIMNSLS